MLNRPAQIDGLENATLPARPVHLAIGMFDGVHLGHRAVIEAAVQSSRAVRAGGGADVLAASEALFSAGASDPLDQDPPIKARVLLGLGVDAVVTQPFTSEFAAVEAPAFLSWLKQRLPKLAAVYVGENFRFAAAGRVKWRSCSPRAVSWA